MKKDARVSCRRLWLTGLFLGATLTGAFVLAHASDQGTERRARDGGRAAGTSGETGGQQHDGGSTGEQDKSEMGQTPQSQRFVPSTKLPADSPVSLPTDI